MRKTSLLIGFIVMTMSLLTFSCSDTSESDSIRTELNELKKRVEVLEQLQQEVDAMYQLLMAENGKYVSAVENITNETGKNGYRILFSDGTDLEIYQNEVISKLTVKEENGVLYWWNGDDWLYSADGSKIPVQTAKPKFRFENGVMMVSVDGINWTKVDIEYGGLPEITIETGDNGFVIVSFGDLTVKLPVYKPETEDKFTWWHNAKFGMFIHWGPNTLRGKSDWAMGYDKVPLAEYHVICSQFNPSGSIEEWIKLAKAAGQKYAVMVTKHHDGYSQFFNDDENSCKNYSVGGRDYVDEFVKACRKHGLRFGFYYSHAQDWSHPGGYISTQLNGGKGPWDEAQRGDFSTYLSTVAVPHVRLLLERYPDCSVFWFDTPGGIDSENVKPFKALMDEHPHVIYNDRIDGKDILKGGLGEFTCPELHVPEEGYPGKKWETCMTMNDHWSYYEGDENWKSSNEIVRMLIDIVSKGGNLLLNIGPDKNAIVPAASEQILKEIGEWMDVYGESIYETDLVSPFRNLQWSGKITGKKGKLYLHLFEWKSNENIFLPLKNTVTKSYLLKDKKLVEYQMESNGLQITLPEISNPDTKSEVIVIEYEGNTLIVNQ